MARLFVAIGGLIVLALTAALVAPHFIDWTSYRADFEREAGRILGRQVFVRGSATARLLPFPSVSFTDVAVAGVEPGETAMTVEIFSMDAELAPFLRGDIHIFDMRLVRPRVVVDLGADGSLDWAVRPSVPVEASHISLERLTVTDGQVELRHEASGRTHNFSEIDAQISARALTGPWRMDGSLRLDGAEMALNVSTGQLDDDGGMRVRMQVRPQLYPFVLESDGNASIKDGRARYAGAFRLNAPVAMQSEAESTTARQDKTLLRLSGAFELDHAALAIPEFHFESGAAGDPYTAGGVASFDLGAAPRFDIRADGAQFRLDGGSSTDGSKDESGGRFSLKERLEALHEILRDMPRPSIPGRIEVALPALVAGDTTLRDLHLVAEPSEAGWTVASAGATLPGRTMLEASGELSTGERLGFDGSLLVAVGQPSGFAAWLAHDVDEAIRRLPAAGFSAGVSLQAERQIFSDLELMLGTAKFTGRIDSRTPEQGRGSLSVRLDGDKLNIEDLGVFAALFISDSGEARMAERDLEIEVVAGPVLAGGLSAETLDTALRLKDGRLEIDRLAIGDLAGANISATGTLRDLDGTPSGNLDATVIAADLEPLAHALAIRFADNRFVAAASQRARNYPGLYQDASLRVVATLAGEGAEQGTLTVDTAGKAGGTTVALTARLREALAAPLAAPLDLVATANSRDAAALYALLGLPSLPLDFTGAAQARLIFDGRPEKSGKTIFSFTGEGVSFSFDGEASLKQTGLSANGKAVMEAEDLDPWLATAGIALPGMGFGLPVSLQAGLDATDGLLVLSGLHGEVADTSLQGNINASLRDGLAHLTGELALADLDLASVLELVAGASALTATDGGWPDTPFVTSPVVPLTADLDLAVGKLAAGGFMVADEARLTLKLARDGLFLSDLDTALYGGTLTGFVDFRNDGGTGLLTAQLGLEGADLKKMPGSSSLAGKAGLRASVSASGKSINALVSALSGSGTLTLGEFSIPGIAPQAFDALLVRADGFGPNIDAAAVAGFAPELVHDGTFEAGSVEAAFTIANGVMRIPPLRLETQGATLAGEVKADLAAGTIGAEAILTYEPGEEALAGFTPAVGLSASGRPQALQTEIDTQNLAQFLTQRALEIQQQRVEVMQAALLERQRLRREVRYYTALAAEREARKEQRLEHERQLREQEDKRRREEEEAARHRAAQEDAHMQQEMLKRDEAERAEAERERLADERLRAEVEALLRARANYLDEEPSGEMLTGEMPAPALSPVLPIITDMMPMPAPRSEAPPPSSPSGGLSVDGLLRAIGAQD